DDQRPRASSSTSPWRLGSLGALLMMCLVVTPGCGRPATEAECREILRRTAELELKDRLNDPALIQAELKEIEDSMHDPMLEKCVGKRITEGAMTCVREA